MKMKIKMKVCLPLVLVAAGLTGCSQPSEPEGTAKAVVEPQQQAAPEAQEVVPATQPKVATEAQNKPKKKLDLSIPTDEMDAGSDLAAGGNDKALLPDMFEKSEARTKIGGDVLRDSENEDYMDSIQGAQLNVEIKTN